jgi:hypothetical protein
LDEREESYMIYNLKGATSNCTLQNFFKFQIMNKKIKVLENVGPNYVLDTALYENNSPQAFMILLGKQSLRIFYVRRSLQRNHNGSRKSQRLWRSLNTNFDTQNYLLMLNHNRS